MFRRSNRQAAVLGCGPAGLFAAHALMESGWGVTIYSNKRRSEMFGAQYLHEPIPGLPSVQAEISYELRGTVEEYRRKVYGDVPVNGVSPESLTGRHAAYDIRAAYYAAWGELNDRIEHRPGMRPWEVRAMLDSKDFRLVVSSLPATSICYGRHNFQAQKIWAIGDAPERGIFCPIATPANTVVCNGYTPPTWYRVSNVFGYKTAEWPEAIKPPIQDLAEVIKPIGTNCDCFTDSKRYLRVGRYGTWTKGVLSHQAYTATKEAIG